MAKDPKERSVHPPNKTIDDLLCEEHERYIQEVTDSGIPRWVYDHYYDSFPHPDVDHTGSEGHDDQVEATKGDLPF